MILCILFLKWKCGAHDESAQIEVAKLGGCFLYGGMPSTEGNN